MHREPGPRVPVQGRQLQLARLQQDEKGGGPHQAVQKEEPQQRLPHLQTAHCPLRLPNQALPGFNDLLSFGFVNDCGSAMRGNGSSWVLEPISCLPWQSAGLFDQTAVRISPPHPLSCTAKAGKDAFNKRKSSSYKCIFSCSNATSAHSDLPLRHFIPHLCSHYLVQEAKCLV